MSETLSRLRAALDGRYRLERELGAGGMATVYLAQDLKHERKVALKVLKPELAAVIGAERFLSEIKTTANLQHPHILPLHDSGEADGLLFYVMPYVQGESLRQRLDRDRQLGVDEAVRIATKVAGALGAAHEQGVIHRDIKPANILLSNGEPLISDFGIALAVSSGGEGRLTETGLSLGTPHYMSPEQATGDDTVGAATDLYALGCVLYEMLVGEPPYTGSSPQAILGKIIQAEPVSATKARRTVPPNVDAVIRRALERVPADRFGSAREFVAALADPAFRHGVHTTATVASSPASGRWLVAAMALVTLATSIVAAWSLTRTSPMEGAIRFVEPPPAGGRFAGPPIVSPDGRTLAMRVGDGSGEWRLWVRPLEAEAARPLEGTDGVTAFAWSPQSDEIAVGVDREVRRIALDGSGTRLVAVMEAETVAWTEEDELIVALAEGGIVGVPATGGAVRPIVEAGTYRSLAVVRGGRHLLAVQFGGETGIHALDRVSDQDRLLVPGVQSEVHFVEPDVFLYRRGSVLVAQRFDPGSMELVGDPQPVERDVGSVAGSASGALTFLRGAERTGRLAWFDREGVMLAEAAPAGRYTEVYVSPDGAHMMFTRDDPDTGAPDLWMQPLEGDGPPSRFTTDPDVDHLATFSPGGETVAWEAHSDGDLIVVRKPVGGRSEPELVGRWGRGGGTSDWSPDGRHLLYHSRDADGSFNLWMIPLSGDEEPFPLVESRFNHRSGSFSPDGRWLAYSSDETGQDELYLQRVEGTGLVGAAIRVSVGGGWEAQWREDGGELFFLSPDAVMAADTRLDRDSPAGTPRVLFSFQASGLPTLGAATRNTYAVTPDGERMVLIVPVAEGEGGSATVVLDWATGVESGR